CAAFALTCAALVLAGLAFVLAVAGASFALIGFALVLALAGLLFTALVGLALSCLLVVFLAGLHLALFALGFALRRLGRTACGAHHHGQHQAQYPCVSHDVSSLALECRPFETSNPACA